MHIKMITWFFTYLSEKFIFILISTFEFVFKPFYKKNEDIKKQEAFLITQVPFNPVINFYDCCSCPAQR